MNLPKLECLLKSDHISANYLTKHDHYMPIVKVMEAEIIKRYGDRRLYNELLDKRVFGTSRVKRSEGKKLGRARTR